MHLDLMHGEGEIEARGNLDPDSELPPGDSSELVIRVENRDTVEETVTRVIHSLAVTLEKIGLDREPVGVNIVGLDDDVRAEAGRTLEQLKNYFKARYGGANDE